MPSDPNWLYSTIAQSAAAIVAIIGGFITACVLNLMAEKRSLANRKKEKQTHLSVHEEEGQRLRKQFETMRVEVFIASVLSKSREVDELPPLDQIIKQSGRLDLDHTILEREYSLLTKQRIQARQFIEQNMKTYPLTKHTSLEDWISGNNLDISLYDSDLLVDEYSRYRSREEEQLKAEAANKYKNLPSAMRPWMMPPGLFSYRGLIDLPNIHDNMADREKEAQIDNTGSRLELLQYEMRLLQNEIMSLDEQIRNFTYPPLGWGLVILAFLTATGIMFPVAVIAFRWYDRCSIIVALTAFFLGIIGLFAYICSLIQTIKK